LLLWILIVLAAMLAMRLINAQAARRRAEPPPRPRAAPPGKSGVPAEAMVRCAHCGIHLPRSEALLQQGQTWCNAEHARLGRPAG